MLRGIRSSLISLILLSCFVSCFTFQKYEYYIWHPLNFYGGRTLHSLRIDAQSPQMLYVATFDAGAYRSDDYGQNWVHINTGLDTPSQFHVLAIQITTADQRSLYTLNGTTPQNIRCRVSVNTGATWRSRTPQFTPPLQESAFDDRPLPFLVHPRDTDVLVVAFPISGVYVSKNGGRDFQHVAPATGSIRAMYWDPHTPNSIVAATGGRHGDPPALLTLSIDEHSWRILSPNVDLAAIFPDVLTPDRWYGVDTENRIVRSDDGGRTWHPLPVHSDSIFQTIDPENGAIDITVSQVDSTLLFATVPGTKGLFRSYDGGVGWEPLLTTTAVVEWRNMWPEFLPDVLMNMQKVVPDPMDHTRVYTYNNFGVWRSGDEGDHWMPGFHGITNQQIVGMYCDPAQDGRVFCLTDQGVLFGRDPTTQQWQWHTTLPLKRPGADTHEPLFAAHTHDNVPEFLVVADAAIAGRERNRLFHSIDGGASWESLPEALPDGMVTVLSYCPDETGGWVAGIAGQGLYRAQDPGGTWVLLTDNPLVRDALSPADSSPATVEGPAPQPGILALRQQDDHWVLWGKDGLVLESQDGGKQWVAINKGLPEVPVWEVAVHPGDARVMYAACGLSGLYRTIDGGASWQQIRKITTTTVALETGSPETVLSGGYGVGVSKSRDAGATWKVIPAPPEMLLIHRLIPNPHRGAEVYVTVRGAGGWWGIFDYAK